MAVLVSILLLGVVASGYVNGNNTYHCPALRICFISNQLLVRNSQSMVYQCSHQQPIFFDRNINVWDHLIVCIQMLRARLPAAHGAHAYYYQSREGVVVCRFDRSNRVFRRLPYALSLRAPEYPCYDRVHPAVSSGIILLMFLFATFRKCPDFFHIPSVHAICVSAPLFLCTLLKSLMQPFRRRVSPSGLPERQSCYAGRVR
jgi:hypothetical protein